MFQKTLIFSSTNIKSSFLHSLLILLTLNSCNQKKEVADTTPKPKVAASNSFNPYENANLTVEVFKIDSIDHNGSRGWGYDIMNDGKIYIHQPNIPAIMGNNGFSSEEKAQEAGEFVIQKLKNNIVPPSVTPEELDSLGVLD
jgi:hypothetical protein